MNETKRIINFSPPDITDAEIGAVAAVMKSGWITTGPVTKRFEAELTRFCGSAKTVCLSSATAALELTLRILGVGPGDEVITSAYTYTASASVIHHAGAKIVFVDTEPGSYEMDYEKLADAVTERTKAVIPVDIGGVMCDYDKLFSILDSKKHLFHPATDLQEAFGRVVVLADAAHSFGASRRGKMSGSAADFTVFSFHAVKNLTTAEGGAVTWINRDGVDNEKLYQEFQLLSLHGQNKDAFNKMKLGSWEYDIVYPAYKCNMTNMTAAFGIVQLERTPQLLEKHYRALRHYDERLLPAGIIRLEHNGEDWMGNGHLYMVRVPGIGECRRNEIIEKMAGQGVACNVHFKPLPMMTAYKKLGFSIDDYPNSYKQYENEISLPNHTLLTEEDIAYVADKFIGNISDG